MLLCLRQKHWLRYLIQGIGKIFFGKGLTKEKVLFIVKIRKGEATPRKVSSMDVYQGITMLFFVP